MTHFSAAEERFCTNAQCLVGRWAVTRCADTEQLWPVISWYEDSPFVVAAPHPVCPYCGDAFLPAFEIDGGSADPTQQEAGPLFDCIRQLR